MPQGERVWALAAPFVTGALREPQGERGLGGQAARFPKLTNEVQHLVKVLAWENIIGMSPLKNGVKWPVYEPRDRQSAKSRQVWIARHQQLLES